MPASGTMCQGIFSLLLLCILISHIVAQPRNKRPRRIDCQRYVYAPRCRGVSAKRNVAGSDDIVSSPSEIDVRILQSLLSRQRSQAKHSPKLIDSKLLDILSRGLRISRTDLGTSKEWSSDEMYPKEQSFDTSWPGAEDDLGSV